jgi:DNA polymerase III subunit alpha
LDFKELKRFDTHGHTEYSNIRLLDCINKIPDFIITASKKGLSGISITDHECLCGHIEALKTEKRLKADGKIPEDFKIALGNEIYLIEKRGTFSQKYYHFILIAKNLTGHRALRELSSIAWYNMYETKRMERVPTTYNDLEKIVNKYPDSLIATSACMGSYLGEQVSNLIKLEQNVAKNEEDIYNTKSNINNYISFCLRLFKDDFYLEIAPSKNKVQIDYNLKIFEIAKAYNIKVVIGTDAHYLTKDEFNIHKSYLNSKGGDRETEDFYSSTYIMDNNEIGEYLIKHNRFTNDDLVNLFTTSNEILNKIEYFDLARTPVIPEEEVPYYEKKETEEYNKYKNIQKYLNSDYEQDRAWINDVLISARSKNRLNDQNLSRIDEEADIQWTISEKLGQRMSSYHNTIRHYIDLFWDNGSIVGPGRGSACGWLTNMLLGITQVDPLKYGLPAWRYLNKERIELGDIDLDLCPSKRKKIFEAIRKKKGELNLLQVCTFGKEATKSAILTACRGYRTKEYPEGIDIDIAQYLSSMIEQERGFVWTINDVLYGNEEKGRTPNYQFINEVKKYDGLLDIIIRIDGLIKSRSQHASGVILYNKSPFESNAVMRSPGGELTTQFNLADCEYVGDTKFDFLLTAISDKMVTCIDLLKKDGYFKEYSSIKEIYNNFLHPDAIDLNDNKIWEALASGNVMDVFQFNSETGLQASKLIQPKTPLEMTAASALMRLMAEKGNERPLDRYHKMKNDINLWYNEMIDVGLTDEQIKTLEKYYKIDYGTPPYQESVMKILMDENISNFTLTEANSARKLIGKKKMDKIPELREKFYSKCKDQKLADYVWHTAVLPQLGYSFSICHSLPYSFVGIQTLYLSTAFPELYWDCACLINNSGGLENNQNGDELNDSENEIEVKEDLIDLYDDNSPEIAYDSDDEDQGSYEDEDEFFGNSEICDINFLKEQQERKNKAKKKNESSDYGRVAVAIGEIRSKGIVVANPDINESDYTFKPDINHNQILYGLKGIVKIGADICASIIKNRPYSSINEVISKNKLTTPQIINLIKSGSLDSFGDREELFLNYLESISDHKNKLDLKNLQMLILNNLFPSSFDQEVKFFYFNKFLKTRKSKNGSSVYLLDDYSIKFYESYFSIDDIKNIKSDNGVLEGTLNFEIWDNFYESVKDKFRIYIKNNQKDLLNKLNSILVKNTTDKYLDGDISKWEMDSICFYNHPHELSNINKQYYEETNFNLLSPKPEIEKVINFKNGVQVPIFKLSKIYGTVLDKDKTKNTISVLTNYGVVKVKIWKNQFVKYDRRISRIGDDGKKHIIEKSWFSRGNKLLIIGIRREDMFYPKIYKSSEMTQPIYLIDSIENQGSLLRFKTEREEE